MSESAQGASEGRTVPADIGAGDPEASAGAIPNLIAGLVETATWRNAARVLLGLLLLGLGYWTYTGVKTALAETRAVSLEALLGTVVKGLDVWAFEHMAEVQRAARNPTSKQFFASGRSQRKTQRGPYYVLQGFFHGKKFSQRIPAAQAGQVQQQVQIYQRFQKLAEDYVSLADQITRLETPAPNRKKNSSPRKSPPPSSRKPPPS